MNLFAGSIELRMLCWAMVLGLVQLIIATSLATKDQGLAYNMSPRDLPPPPVSVLAARMQRAFLNFKETFVFFAAAALLVVLTGHQNANTSLGAEIYLGARLVYVPVYAAGIPVLRTLVWTVSIIGLVMVLAAALT